MYGLKDYNLRGDMPDGAQLYQISVRMDMVNEADVRMPRVSNQESTPMKVIRMARTMT
jgi:hypothetical protein